MLAFDCDVTRWNTCGAVTSAEPSTSRMMASSSRRSAPEKMMRCIDGEGLPTYSREMRNLSCPTVHPRGTSVE